MGRARSSLLLASLLLVMSACTHDYDALREEESPDIRAGENGGAGSSGGGSGGSSGTTGGSGGSSGTTGGSGGVGGSSGGTGGSGGSGGSSGDGGISDACEPCAEPSEPAMSIGLESCCRGSAGEECGLAFDDDATCHALDVPGEDDTSCPPVGPVMMRHEGCCRADARCGARFDMLGLGCVAREDIPVALAPNAAAMPCELACEEDVDCSGAPDVTALCVPKRQLPDERYCAVQCQRDDDCGDGLVCALSPDPDKDRLVAFCQEPYGDRETDEVCTAANQCVHGVCLRLTGQTDATCSQFCEADDDCPASREFCVQSSIARPSGMGTAIDFDVCSSQDD